MARSAGKKPAAIPTKTANTRDSAASHSGIKEIEEDAINSCAKAAHLLMINEIE